MTCTIIFFKPYSSRYTLTRQTQRSLNQLLCNTGNFIIPTVQQSIIYIKTIIGISTVNCYIAIMCYMCR